MSIMSMWNKHLEDAIAGRIKQPSPEQNDYLAKLSNCKTTTEEVFDYIFEVAQKQDDKKMSELAQHFKNKNELKYSLVACNNLLTIVAFHLKNFDQAVAIFLKSTYVYAKEISKEERELLGSFMTCYLSASIIVMTKSMENQRQFLATEGKNLLQAVNEKIQLMLTEM